MQGNKLKAKIVERGLNIEGFAALIDMNRSSAYRMLNNPKKITIDKAMRIKKALELSNEEASAIFFS